jgi:hypothetical protein
MRINPKKRLITPTNPIAKVTACPAPSIAALESAAIVPGADVVSRQAAVANAVTTRKRKNRFIAELPGEILGILPAIDSMGFLQS